jgi:molybdopterin synthase catalytic subunit
MAGRIHSAVSLRPLDPAEAFAFVADPACGAVASFIGVVRQTNLGRDVVAVSYDAFEELATNILDEIAREALQADPAMNIYVVHHKGRLDVGGISIVIAVSSPHRAEAFEAARRIIEQVKHRVPVWKQEHYADGDDDWVKGHALGGNTHDERR